VGAITDSDFTDEVWGHLAKPDQKSIAIFSSEVLQGVEDALSLPTGSLGKGKLVTALKRIGFTYVWDRDFFGELGVLGEALFLKNSCDVGKVTPIVSGCSLGFMNFINEYYPKLKHFILHHKRPEDLAKNIGDFSFKKIKKKSHIVVSFLPCISRKYEVRGRIKGVPNWLTVDQALTVRELLKMIKTVSFDLLNLPETPFDQISVPIGNVGLKGTLPRGSIDSMTLRLAEAILGITREGEKGRPYVNKGSAPAIREFKVSYYGKKIDFFLVFGLAAAHEVLSSASNRKVFPSYVRIMCCPQGCLGGGGQSFETIQRSWQERLNTEECTHKELGPEKLSQMEFTLPFFQDYFPLMF
jgi:NADH-quinone oxidoreductase subunit G/NADP-reducing hydrogenase subunit HndD